MRIQTFIGHQTFVQVLFNYGVKDVMYNEIFQIEIKVEYFLMKWKFTLNFLEILLLSE